MFETLACRGPGPHACIARVFAVNWSHDQSKGDPRAMPLWISAILGMSPTKICDVIHWTRRPPRLSNIFFSQYATHSTPQHPFLMWTAQPSNIYPQQALAGEGEVGRGGLSLLRFRHGGFVGVRKAGRFRSGFRAKNGHGGGLMKMKYLESYNLYIYIYIYTCIIAYLIYTYHIIYIYMYTYTWRWVKTIVANFVEWTLNSHKSQRFWALQKGSPRLVTHHNINEAIEGRRCRPFTFEKCGDFELRFLREKQGHSMTN